MANYTAINIEQVQDVKDVIHREILETATGINESIWKDLSIAFQTGIESKDSKFVFDGNTSVAAAKFPGSELASGLGDMLERELVVKPMWARVPDSLDNYREKEPISIARLSEDGVTGEATQFQLLQAAKLTAGQVRSNFFLGKRPASKAAAEALSVQERKYTLYDGIYQKIADMKAGTNTLDKDAEGNPLISEEKGNLIPTEPMLGAATAADCYDAAVEFYQKLDPELLDGTNGQAIAYVCPQLHRRLIQGFLEKYTGLQSVEVNKPNYRFVDMPNLEFRSHAALGYGDQIIVTVEENLEYGTDMNTNGDPSNAYVHIMQDQNDAHTIIIQIDLAAGTRILKPTKDAFATNDQLNYATPAEWKAAQTAKP